MKNLNISIGVPAYNEENNIRQTILSLLKQKVPGHRISEIIVVSDGSTDLTNEYVIDLSKKYPLLKLIKHAKRRGKVARLNEIYQLFRGDFLCLFDADIIIPPGTVNGLVAALKANPNNLLVSAHQIPLNGKSFASRVIRAAYQFWDDTRLAVPNGDHIQNFYGAAAGYRGSFARSLRLPFNLTDERGYIYLSAKQKGNFLYLFNYPIYYWPVTTFKDFFKLGDRSFGKNITVLKQYFSLDVDQAYLLPAKYKISAITHNLLKNPLYTSLGLIINLLSRLFTVHDPYYEQGMWEISQSTKQGLKGD